MSSHSKFFSSLKQVEKRLKLENTTTKTTESDQVQESNYVSTLNSPLFLQPSCSQTCQTQENSEPPQQFLSISQGFSLTHQDPSQEDDPTIVNEVQEDVDEIERLMMLLGMTEEKRCNFDFDDDDDDDNDCDSCHCEDGFYSKIVGVEGPKCKKEVLRLNGWIKHFLNDGMEKKEPLRLAHLLLGKAAFVSEAGFAGLDFPSTIQEFLHTDPPSE